MNINGNRAPTDSPCIGLCSTTYGDAVCRGCKRTAEEVRDWNSYDDERKININRRLEESNDQATIKQRSSK